MLQFENLVEKAILMCPMVVPLRYRIPKYGRNRIIRKPTAAAVLFTTSYLEIARSQFMIKY